MPQIQPLPAIRFNPARVGRDLSALLAPPYDVLNERNKAALLAKSEHNIVAIDLPHLPPKSAGPPEAYAGAAKRLDNWLAEGILMREPRPALYLYHQRFQHSGNFHTRRMFVARVRLSPFSDGQVLPHEQTFGGPKEDRLALMKATRCNLSAIFALYTDPDNAIASAFAAISEQPPDVYGTVDSVENRLWAVTDDRTIDAVASAMADEKVYIADGHHRYETALHYRHWLAEEAGGSLPQEHPANYVMIALASMDDPGCLILPYHRVLANVDLSTLLSAWAPGTSAAATGQVDLTLHEGATGARAALRFTDRARLAALEPNRPKPWQALDIAYIHRYLIDELLAAVIPPLPRGAKGRSSPPAAPGLAAGGAPVIHYVRSEQDAIRTAEKESGVALLVNAITMAQLRAVSEAGGIMPQKSTCFHPKLATGLAINPLQA